MLVREPRSTDATTICFAAWSRTTTAPATTPASRHARTAVPTARSAVDEIGHQLPDDQQDDRRDHRAQVDGGRAEPRHRQDAAKEVEVRVDDVADEGEEDVEHAVVGHPRHPTHQHPDED